MRRVGFRAAAVAAEAIFRATVVTMMVMKRESSRGFLQQPAARGLARALEVAARAATAFLEFGAGPLLFPSPFWEQTQLDKLFNGWELGDALRICASDTLRLPHAKGPSPESN